MDVLISIQPKHIQNICEQIGEKDGKPLYKKTIEVRKTKPNLEIPFRCLIYATKPKNYYTITGFGRASDEYLWLANGKVKMSDGFEYIGAGVKYQCLSGKVIGEFICRGLMPPHDSLKLMAKESCLTEEELLAYANGGTLYGWRIDDLKIYDKPKELGEFSKRFVFDNKPMKDWCHNNCEICDEENCKYDLRIKRPPQSWCYVEGISK